MLSIALLYTLEGLKQSRRVRKLLCLMAALTAALIALAFWEADARHEPTIPRSLPPAEYSAPDAAATALRTKAREYASGEPNLRRTVSVGQSNAERLPRAMHQATLQRGWLSSNVHDGILITLPEDQLPELDIFADDPPLWLTSPHPAPGPDHDSSLTNVLLETNVVADHTPWPMRLLSMTQTAVLTVDCVLMLMALHKFVATTDHLRGKRSFPPWMTAFSKGLPKSAEGSERDDRQGTRPCQDCGNPTRQIITVEPEVTGLCRWCDTKRNPA